MGKVAIEVRYLCLLKLDCLIFKILPIFKFPFGAMAIGKLGMRWALTSLLGFSLFPISNVCQDWLYTKATSDSSLGRTWKPDFQPSSCERVICWGEFKECLVCNVQNMIIPGHFRPKGSSLAKPCWRPFGMFEIQFFPS